MTKAANVTSLLFNRKTIGFIVLQEALPQSLPPHPRCFTAVFMKRSALVVLGSLGVAHYYILQK